MQINGIPIVERGDPLGTSEYTREKLRILGSLFGWHIQMVQSIWRRRPGWITPPYLYFDLNAGMGRYRRDEEPDIVLTGSPLLFLEVASRLDLTYQAVLIEEVIEYSRVLRQLVNEKWWWELDHGRVRIHNGDNATIIREHYTGWQDEQKLGFVYMDFNGVPDLDLIESMSLQYQYKKLDVLLHLGATSIKRESKAHDRPCLIDRLLSIDKANWLIREPYGDQQWTFMWGTNNPKQRSWKREHFHLAGSKEGQRILERLNYTNRELDRLDQMSLPLVKSGCRIEPTQNIFGIRRLDKSEARP